MIDDGKKYLFGFPYMKKKPANIPGSLLPGMWILLRHQFESRENSALCNWFPQSYRPA